MNYMSRNNIDPNLAAKMEDRKKSLFKFNCYSYFENFYYTILNFLPHPIRILFFKIMFRKLGQHVFIDHGCYFRYPYQISIGNNVSINRKCSIFGSYYDKSTLIVIGNNVAIAPEVKIFSASHDYQDISLPDYGEGIYIEDYVWIGGGAIILPGVKIGKGSVIGAGSIVTHDIPDWSVAVGNPARVIKKRVLNEREVFNELIPEIRPESDKENFFENSR